MVHVKNPEMSQELLKWEQRSVFKSYKFGILYCKEGQSTEEEIFGNGMNKWIIIINWLLLINE